MRILGADLVIFVMVAGHFWDLPLCQFFMIRFDDGGADSGHFWDLPLFQYFIIRRVRILVIFVMVVRILVYFGICRCTNIS